MADVKIRVLSEDKTKAGLKSVDDKMAKLVKTLGLAALAVTTLKKSFEFIKESTLLAARVETLAVVTQTLGENAGYTAGEIRALEKAIQDQGITTQASRQALAQMMQANLDLADATDLARLAQDAAVIAGTNSSEAFQKLINVITTGNVRMARTMGLQVDFNKGYHDMAEQLGKTTDELTAQEKSLSRSKSVMAEGTQIAGAYEAAMDSVGKQLESTARHVEEFKVAVGESNIESLGFVNTAAQKWLKSATARLKVETLLKKAVEFGIIGNKEMFETLEDLSNKRVDAADILEGLIALIEEETVRREELTAIMEMENDLRSETIDLRSGEIEAADQLIKRTELLAQAQERTLVTTTSLLDGINRQIDSPIENFIEDLEWFIVTGGRIEEAFGNIQEAVGRGLMTPEEGLAAARALLEETVKIQELMEGTGVHEIKRGETLGGIAATLDTSLEKMLELNEQITNPNLILAGEALVTPFGEMAELLAGDEGIIASLERVDQIAGEAQGVLSFRDAITSAHDELITMSSTQFDIDIRLNYTSSGEGRGRGQRTLTSTSGAEDMFTDKILERMGDLQ